MGAASKILTGGLPGLINPIDAIKHPLRRPRNIFKNGVDRVTHPMDEFQRMTGRPLKQLHGFTDDPVDYLKDGFIKNARGQGFPFNDF